MRLSLTERDAFGLPPGLPPAWVVGDLDAVPAGEWVLVVSLNQARREEEEDWHVAQRYTSQSYRDHWRFLNRDWWEPGFYRPLVRLAGTALDLAVDQDDEAAFATTRMIFVELCPYPSRQFSLDGPTIEQLAVDDIGFRTAAAVRSLLIEEGEPATIVVNGVAAVRESSASMVPRSASPNATTPRSVGRGHSGTGKAPMRPRKARCPWWGSRSCGSRPRTTRTRTSSASAGGFGSCGRVRKTSTGDARRTQQARTAATTASTGHGQSASCDVPGGWCG